MNQMHYQPEQQYGYHYQQPPQKSNNCLIAAVIGGLIAFVGICICAGSVVLIGAPMAALWDEIADEWAPVGVDAPTSGGPVVRGETSTSLAVGSHEGGVVSSPSGARLDIPPAAVPLTDAGENGTMVFSIEEDTQTTAALPEGFAAAGPVYLLGPAGFNFNHPVILSLPIPAGVDVDTVVGLAYYDAVAGDWKLAPGAVSAEEREVSVSTVHFSLWTIARSTQSAWQRQNGGWVTISNLHTYNAGLAPGIPDARYNRYGVTYGICIVAFAPDDSNVVARWAPPQDWIISVSDYYDAGRRSPPPRDWWLPAGSYEILEVAFASEINPGDPLYVPRRGNSWRQWGVLRVEPGSRTRFERSAFDAEGWLSWTHERPQCLGVQTTSVGTGDVQITLTWSSNDDLDLHVIDPQGNEIYYANTSVPSGGQLDRDNRCGNMVIGRPENIFWPTGAAPTGEYQVYVKYYGACDSPRAVNFTVRIVVSGQTQSYTGRVTSVGEMPLVTTFTVR